MPEDNTEELLPEGESSQDRFAFERYKAEVQRGKSLLQLQAVAKAITPEIRASWSARSFTPIATSAGNFDALICNISYHFHKHGSRFGTIQQMTDAARQYFRDHRLEGKPTKDGLLKLPDGSLFEPTGKIVTFV